MDHARKLGKPERSTIWGKGISPPCSISDKPLVKDEEVTEDKRLRNWQKWLIDRKKLCRHYGKSIDRDHQDLLINRSPDNFRRNVEMKEIMEMTVGLANKKKTDGYRGNPGFWVTPEFLAKRDNPNLPNIAITLTKRQLNVLTEIEQVTLPELTQKEKGPMLQKERIPMWKRNGGAKILEPTLNREIKCLEAKEADLKGLAVKGIRLGQKKLDLPKVPVITVTGTNTFEDKNDRNLYPEDAIILKIQDREIKLIESRKGSDRTNLGEIAWSLIFKSSGFDITERAIRLENLGTLTITYHWRYGSSGTILIPQASRNSPFFFNKKKNLILPGQVTVLRVWFRCQRSCLATEFWTLITDPKVSHQRLVLRFWGCCRISPETSNIADKGFGQNSKSVERYLERRIRDAKIQEIIHEIVVNALEKARVSSLPAYGSLFLEREIFEAKNPQYFYHSQMVHQFKNIYESAVSGESPSWSLSLNELRRVLMQLRNDEMRNEALVRFNELSRNSLEPSLHNPIGNTKHSFVYSLMCSFANKFEAENEYVRTKCYCGPNEDKMGGSVIQGDTQSSFKNSFGRLTPRRNSNKIDQPPSRTKSAGKLTLPTINPETVKETLEKIRVGEPVLYKQVFHMRIRAMLMDTIVEICGVVDTVNNLQAHGM